VSVHFRDPYDVTNY